MLGSIISWGSSGKDHTLGCHHSPQLQGTLAQPSQLPHRQLNFRDWNIPKQSSKDSEDPDIDFLVVSVD